MIGEVAHIGVTVSNIDRSIDFYQNVLGLKYQGRMIMSGDATDRLFRGKDIVAQVAYLNGSDNLFAPPIELICFENDAKQDKADLFKTSISEICFITDDIFKTYDDLKKKGVDFLSEPQEFDFTSSGFSKSIAVYFRDPDGIILELIEYIK